MSQAEFQEKLRILKLRKNDDFLFNKKRVIRTWNMRDNLCVQMIIAKRNLEPYIKSSNAALKNYKHRCFYQ